MSRLEASPSQHLMYRRSRLSSHGARTLSAPKITRLQSFSVDGKHSQPSLSLVQPLNMHRLTGGDTPARKGPGASKLSDVTHAVTKQGGAAVCLATIFAHASESLEHLRRFLLSCVNTEAPEFTDANVTSIYRVYIIYMYLSLCAWT